MKEINGWWVPDADTHIAKYMKTVGQNEYQPVHQYESTRHCKRFRTALDIGAHVGLWARGLVKKFDTVLCFEPCDEYVEMLMKNVPAENKTVYRCALGERPDMVKMSYTPAHTMETHVIRGVRGDTPMRTLDSLNLTDVDFIKIDVEGYELEVLKGATETLTRNDPVIILEQKDRYIRLEDGPRAAVLYLMKEHGYKAISKVADDWIMAK